jgi:hypothetical protein
MNAQQMKNGSLFLVPALAAMLVVQACGGGGNALADEQADPMEGVWESVVTQRDCTSSATLATFRASQIMHRGGGLTDTNAAPPASRGVGFGNWARQSDGRYAIKFRFFRYNADGSVAGTSVVTSTRTLAADGNSTTGDTRAEVRDSAGQVLSTICVSDAATRFR